MNKEPFRQMTEKEKELIQKLLEPEFPGRDELAQQLRTASVRVIDEDGGLEIAVNSNVGTDLVKYRVPTEGEYEDPDGGTVHVLLHVIGGKAGEIEFYREDNLRVQTWPVPKLMRVFAPK